MGFLMTFYYHDCYVYIENLFIWKYIKFINYYIYQGITIIIILRRVVISFSFF